ncbi:hypothetical protein FACS1894110_14860 [Spirochaetia bacterium]|nr:hypothetical protein FACS1894110_14860 [Spirochaetia bacterium]
MKKKSLVVGTIALLLTAVVFLGCPTEATDSETNTVTNTVTEYVDSSYQLPADAVRATSRAGLEALLGDTDISKIYITSISLLQDGDVLPAGNNLYVQLSGATVTATALAVEEGASLTFFDNGTTGSSLTFSTSKKLGIGGTVNIENGITIANTTDLTEITSFASGALGANTVVGSNKLVIGKGATLSIRKGDLAASTGSNKLSVADAWAAAGQGSLTVAEIDNAAIGLEALNLNTVNDKKRKFTISALSVDVVPGTSLTIYGNTYVTTSGNSLILAAITSLTVDGSLTSTSTGLALTALENLTVNGIASLASTTLPAIKSITVGARGDLTVGGTMSGVTTGTALTIRRNGTASLAGAPKLANSTIEEGGYLILGGSPTFLAATTRLSVAAGTKVNGIEFPVAASLSAATSAGATLASSITIPEAQTLVIATSNVLTVPADVVITLAAADTFPLGGGISFGNANTSQLVLSGAGAGTAGAKVIFAANTSGLELTASAAAALLRNGSGKFSTGAGDDGNVANLPGDSAAAIAKFIAGGTGSFALTVKGTAAADRLDEVAVFGESS